MGNFETAETDKVMANIFKKKTDVSNQIENLIKGLTPQQAELIINKIKNLNN